MACIERSTELIYAVDEESEETWRTSTRWSSEGQWFPHGAARVRVKTNDEFLENGYHLVA